MVKGKVWNKLVNRLGDLNVEARDKIVMVKKLDEGILLKAEVVGVKGILCLESECNIEEAEVPVKILSETEWEKLR